MLIIEVYITWHFVYLILFSITMKDENSGSLKSQSYLQGVPTLVLECLRNKVLQNTRKIWIIWNMNQLQRL